MADTRTGDGPRKKRRREPLTLEVKANVIMCFESGMTVTEVSRKFDLPRTTVSGIVINKEKYLREIRSSTSMNCKTIRKRDGLVADMEKLLTVWIQDQTQENGPLSLAIIQAKARELFEDLKAKRGEASKDETFSASRGWFDRFKKRGGLYNINMQCDEAASTDTEATEEVNIQIPPAPSLSLKGLSEAFILLEGAMDIFEKEDPNPNRSANVNAGILEACACYKEILQEKKKELIQTSLHTFFKKPLSVQHSDNIRLDFDNDPNVSDACLNDV